MLREEQNAVEGDTHKSVGSILMDGLPDVNAEEPNVSCVRTSHLSVEQKEHVESHLKTVCAVMKNILASGMFTEFIILFKKLTLLS